MILLCPHCGRKLNKILKDGITTCESCKRIFDSSDYNTLLSAAWICRRWHVPAVTAQKHCVLTNLQTDMIDCYICKEGLTHDEFIHLLGVISVG